MSSLPFVVAGLPSDLRDWDIEGAVDEKRSDKRKEEQMEFLGSVIDDSGVGEMTRKKLIKSGRVVSERTESGKQASIPAFRWTLSKRLSGGTQNSAWPMPRSRLGIV